MLPVTLGIGNKAGDKTDALLHKGSNTEVDRGGKRVRSGGGTDRWSADDLGQVSKCESTGQEQSRDQGKTGSRSQGKNHVPGAGAWGRPLGGS